MTTHLDLFVDFAVSAEVCGAGLGTEPGAWVAALGPRYVDNEHLLPTTLIRYFGIVTATFGRDGDRWLCHTIGIKPGDVARFPDMVPAPIAERYGEIPAQVPFDEVADRLAAAGVEIYHVPRRDDVSPEIYWVPAGRALFYAVAPCNVPDLKHLRLGDIYSVDVTDDPDIYPRTVTRYR